jgi:TRAP-type mannitol/chloroaromatic compound transport system substrate-binding protein
MLLAATSAGLCGNKAGQPVTIDVASTFPGDMPVLGEVSRGLPDKILRASGGDLLLRFYEPGRLVPAADAVNAVAGGTVAAAWAGAGWFADKNSAFNMFSSVPFGPGIGEYLAWLYRGGGLKLARAMFHQHGVHNIPCGIIPPEASGWFRNEIRNLGDLKGLKMRFYGLGAKVMQKFGVITNLLPPSEIMQALRSGALDATEFSLPAMDQPLGFYHVAKFYYFPGWHQQATIYDLYFNKAGVGPAVGPTPGHHRDRLRRLHARDDRRRRSRTVEGDEGDAGRRRSPQALAARDARRLRAGVAGRDRGRVGEERKFQARL